MQSQAVHTPRRRSQLRRLELRTVVGKLELELAQALAFAERAPLGLGTEPEQSGSQELELWSAPALGLELAHEPLAELALALERRVSLALGTELELAAAGQLAPAMGLEQDK